MNETLKQRIVGVAVLTAIAAIFVPMLFDDPVPDDELYTNELVLPQAQPDNDPLIVKEPAVPSLIKQPVAEDLQHALDNIPATADEVLSQPVPAQVDLQKKAIQQSIKETSITGWIIQVGSFSQEKNALEFRDKLRKNKFTAYVDSTTTAKHGTLYRLRVGPELDEKRALKTKQMLESQYRVKTLLVSE